MLIIVITIKQKLNMPIKDAAKKSLRQNKKRRAANLRRKRKYKSLKKKIEDLVSKKELEKAKKFLPDFQKAVDKAAKKGTIHKNKAARLKSRLAKKIKGES